MLCHAEYVARTTGTIKDKDVSFDFTQITQISPKPLTSKADDLQRPLIKILKHVFKIIAPYFFGPKHTDMWGIGRFVSKLIGKNTIDTQCADGKWLCLPLPVYTSHFLYGPDHKRFNKDNITPLMRKYATSGSIAIDVGASCGQEVLALSQAVGDKGHVYCFEPSMSYEALLRTVALNELTNVTCVRAGCGNENGYIGGSDTQEYFIGDEYSYSDSGMPVIRIDDFLAYIKEKRSVSLIKIDTDGFEYEVVQGAHQTITNYNSHIIAEFEPHFNYSGVESADVLKRYTDNGFELHKIQISAVPLNPKETVAYIKDMQNPDNMIAHDIVLKRKSNG